MNQRNDGSSRRRTQNQSSRAYTSQGTRNTGTQRRSGYSKKRKNKLDITHYLMYGIGILILIVCVVLGFNSCRKSGGPVANTEAETTQEETELKKSVTVDGIDITGKTREQAKEVLTSHYQWGMTVSFQEEQVEITNLIADRIDRLLDEIYQGEPKESYQIDTADLGEQIATEVAAIAAKWDVSAKNGGIQSFSKETGKFTFADGSNGIVIDQEQMIKDIEKALADKAYDIQIQAKWEETKPQMSGAQAKEKYGTIGTYTTTTTSNKDRNENIRLASEALNGVILQPGEVFSFNDTTGARTVAKGYKPAGAYVNGELVEEPGGGVCQVSSTIYNAVVFSGLKTTERQPHSYEPSYVTPGEDAMVNFGTSDMKFLNNSDFPVAIRASFADRKLTISIYGVPVLEPGVQIKMRSEKTEVIAPPAPVYEENQALQLTEEKVIKEGTPGSRWKTYLVTYKDGNKVSEEFFHNSSYRGKAGIIQRNTSGVVVTTEASVSADSSSQADGGDGTTALDPTETLPANQPGQSPGPGVHPIPDTTQPVTQAPTQAPTQPTSQPNPGNVGPGGGSTDVVAPNPGGPGGGGNAGPGGPG